jgi:hypothetical protein
MSGVLGGFGDKGRDWPVGIVYVGKMGFLVFIVLKRGLIMYW